MAAAGDKAMQEPPRTLLAMTDRPEMNPMTVSEDYVPCRAADLVVRRFDGEAVIWAAHGPGPVRLDPVAAVISDIIDGAASVGDLIDDVHGALGVDRADAAFHIERCLHELGTAGALEGITGRAGPSPDYFPFPPST